jgi:iron complex transport system substrate-binding protein
MAFHPGSYGPGFFYGFLNFMKKQSILILVLLLACVGVGLSTVLRNAALFQSAKHTHARPIFPSAFPQRIICAAPNIVETIYALGEERRIVGISDFVTYPPEALKIVSVGGMIDPNFERILQLQPDLVIIQGAMQKHRDFCDEKKIPLLRVDMESIDSIFEGIRSIGLAIGCLEKAEQLIQEKKKILDEIRQKASFAQNKPSVFICLGRRAGSLASIFTVHPASFVDELVTIAGGSNIFGDVKGRYPQISKEALLQRNPEIILELHPGEELSTEGAKTLKADWNAMPGLSVAASGRIFVVTDDYLLVSGPRLSETARRLYEILHGADQPEANPMK